MDSFVVDNNGGVHNIFDWMHFPLTYLIILRNWLLSLLYNMLTTGYRWRWAN